MDFQSFHLNSRLVECLLSIPTWMSNTSSSLTFLRSSCQPAPAIFPFSVNVNIMLQGVQANL